MPLVVRRKNVMNALNVLKEIHSCYDDVCIDKMPSTPTKGKQLEINPSIRDSNRSINQSHCHDEPTSDIAYSAISATLPTVPRDNSKVSFVDNLKKCAKETKAKVPILDFPPTKEEPLRYVKLSY